tara:strand:+ start:33 stop:674 length:642 start_codon:yes stop_codon:yes gene_type:complete
MDVNYLSNDELIKKTVSGEINIVDGINLSKKIKLSYEDNLNKICYNEKKHLIDLLISIKKKLEKKLTELLTNNEYVKDYIKHVLDNEWLLSINPVNIIDKEEIQFSYSDYFKIKNEYKRTNNKKLQKKFKELQKNLIDICKRIEPTYMYVLIDLSSKPKIEYIKFNEISDNKLKLKSDMNIRFINYVQILNYIKKELNMIINECHSIIKLMNK